MSLYKNGSMLAAVVGSMALALAAESSQAVVFTTADIVNNQIKFDYNSIADTHYLNGVNTGQSFAVTVDTNNGVVNPGYALIPTSANYPQVHSFIYSFTVPTGYVISSVSIGYYFASAPGSGTGNAESLSWSTDQTNWNVIDSLTSINDWYGKSGTASTGDISSYGVTTYYIKGAYDFSVGTGSNYPDTFQFFRAANATDAASAFTNLITVTAVPEVSSVGLLATSGLMLIRRRK